MTKNDGSGMYGISSADRLYKLSTLPKPLAESEVPQMVADGATLCIAYPTSVPESNKARMAIIKFTGVTAHFFESSHDSTIGGHPLIGLGLTPLAAFTVKQSSWARDNSVPDARHLVIAFADRTLDVLCDGVGFRYPSTEDGDTQSALQLSMTDTSLKWWFVSEKKKPGRSKPMQRDWLKEGIVAGINEVTIFSGSDKTKWQRFADWIAQRQMRRAFGRRRTDL